jgi:uncharacterized protein
MTEGRDIMKPHGPDAAGAEAGPQGILRPGRWLPARALAWAIVGAVVLVVASQLTESAAGGLLASRGPLFLLPASLGALVALALYRLGVRAIERRAPHELSLAKLAPELTAGLLLGAAAFAVVMGVLLVVGAYALTGPKPAVPWEPLAISISSGVVEELVFRGIIFRLLWSTLGMWWALVVSSALFGAAHLINPHADIMAALGIIFGAGLPLAAVYILTRALWAPIGCHLAWNFTGGYVFGAQVSGLELGPSLYRVQPVEGVGVLWTGGTFGPEASLPTALLGLLAGAALLVVAARRRA